MLPFVYGAIFTFVIGLAAATHFAIPLFCYFIWGYQLCAFSALMTFADPREGSCLV